MFASARGVSVADLPMQLAIWHNPAPDPRWEEQGAVSLARRFPLGSGAVVVASALGPPPPVTGAAMAAAAAAAAAVVDASVAWAHHGRVGEVVGVDEAKGVVRLRAPVLPREPPFGLAAAAAVADKYFPAGGVARSLGVRPDILGRVLG